MIDTTVLRERILDMAIRGKLVPQDPNDEPASVLLERIREEKKQLVKEGKLKKKDLKDDTIIFRGEDNLHYEKLTNGNVKCIEEGLPFELPEGWAWCKLESIAAVITDYVANGSFASLKANVRTYKEKNYALFVRTVDFANNFNGDLSYIDQESYDFLEKSKLFGGELMLSNIGASIGKVFKVPFFDTPMSLAPNAIIIRFFNDITSDYFEYVFKSFVGQDYLQFLSGGAAMPKFNKTDLRAMIVPIPPLKEQTKIVEAAKNIFSLIDSLDNSYDDLISTTQSVKSKILNLAISGKLVPQNPNDEPASVLLERIRIEKEEQIRNGKIKRDKKESIIFKGDDNSYYRLDSNNKRNIIDIPFDIPDNWEWCNLSMIGSTNIGLTYKPADIVTEGTMVLRSSNIINGKLDLSDLVRVNTTIRENQYIQKNDILICARNGSKALVGKCAIFENVNEKASFGAFMAVYRSSFFKYVYYFLNSDFFRNTFSNDDSKQINQLTQDMIKNTTIPLPPFAEQKRIVEAIETAFAQLDIITHSIS